MPRLTPLVVLLAACKPDEEPDLGPGALVDLSTPVGVDVQTRIGPAGEGSIARAVNEVGAAIPSDPLPVTVGGSTIEVSFDGTGFGDLSLAVAGSEVVTGALRPAEVHTVDAAWSPPGVDRAWISPETAGWAAGASRGWLVGTETSLWWASPDATYPVMTFSGGVAIAGARATHLDGDGLLDAVVWGGGDVVLLKARPVGGLAFLADVRSDGALAVGAASGDLDGDGNIDVAIAWDSPALQIWRGDGLGGFVADPVIPLRGAPGPVAIGDNTSSGKLQVTVLIEGDGWQRYEWADGQAIEVGPDLTGSIPFSAELYSIEMNGDGADELVFLGDVAAGADRDVRVYDLFGEAGQNPTFLPLSLPSAQIAMDDLDGDGNDDLMMAYEDGAGVALSSNGTSYIQHGSGDLGLWGPVALTEQPPAEAPSLLVAGDTWWRVFDGIVNEDPDDGSLRYDVGETAGEVVADVDLGAAPLRIELDGDPATLELASITEEAGVLYVTVWEAGADGLEQSSRTALPGDPDPQDLAVCDGIAWVAAGGYVSRVDLDSGSIVSDAFAASRIDCGVGPGSAHAAALADTSLKLYNDLLQSTNTTSVDGGTVDIGIVTLGDGPEVKLCSAPDCGALAWRFSEDSAFVWSDGTGVHAELVDGTVADLGPAGIVGKGDVDMDGHEDLLVTSASPVGAYVRVYRSTGAGWGPPEAFAVPDTLATVPFSADSDGDGATAWWAVNADGDVLKYP